MASMAGFRGVLAAAAAAASLGLAGCETAAIGSYQASPATALALRSAARGQTGIGVSDFSAGQTSETFKCRGISVRVTAQDGMGRYVGDAVRQELLAAGLYGDGPVKISGSVDDVELKTVGRGAWTVALTVRSQKGDTLSKTATFEFPSSWAATQACQNAATAFPMAVQMTISSLVADPSFAQFLR